MPSPYTVVDPVDDDPDVTVPGNDPAGNVASAMLEIVGGNVTVSVQVVAPDDPHTSSRWRTEVWFKVHFVPPSEQHTLIFQHQATIGSPFNLPGQDVIARFEDDDSCGRPVFVGQYVNGMYRATFPLSCLGSPGAVRFRVSFHSRGDQAVDETELSPPVLRPKAMVSLSPSRLLDTRGGVAGGWSGGGAG